MENAPSCSEALKELATASILKAALDGTEPTGRPECGLGRGTGLAGAGGGVHRRHEGNDAAHACLKVAHQVGDQDVDLTGVASALRAGSNTPSPTSGTREAAVPDVGIIVSPDR